MSNSLQMSPALAGPGLENATGRWVYVDASGRAQLQTDNTSTETAGILARGAREGDSCFIAYTGLFGGFVAGGPIDPWDFVTCDSQGRTVSHSGSAVVLGRFTPAGLEADQVNPPQAVGDEGNGVLIDIGLVSGGGGAVSSVFARTGDVVADPGDYDTLTTLDVTNEFSAGGDTLVTTSGGNIGLGTATPTDYALPGFRTAQLDAATLAEFIISLGGARVGSLLATAIGFVLSSDNDSLFLAANTNNQLNMLSTGEVQIPNLNGGAGTRALRWNDADGEVFQVEMGLYVEAIYSGTGPLDITTGGGIVPADASSTLIGFTQTPSFAEFTCTIAGVYEITGRVAGNMTGGNNRTIWTSWIEVDGVRAEFSFAQVYSRNSAHGDFSLETKMVIALGVGQVVALVQGRKIGPGTGPFEGTGTGLQITRIG